MADGFILFGGIIGRRNTWAMDHGGSWQWSPLLKLAAFMFIVSRSCSSVGNFTCPTCISWSQSDALSTLRWKNTASWQCTKRAKVHDTASRIMTFYLFHEIILVQHTSLLWFFVLLKSQPSNNEVLAGWLGGWMSSAFLSIISQSASQKSRSSSSIPCVFHFDFLQKMLARPPDFCINSLSCRYHSPISCENSGWSLSALWWILEKNRDLWQVRNCRKSAFKSYDAKSGINPDELSFAQHFSSCQDAVSAPGKQFERKTQERNFSEQNNMNK